MTCIIIDDEFPARLLLERYVSKIPYLRHVKSFKNPVEALHFMKDQPVDLMFVDIQMPQLTGTEFLRSFNKKPLAILTTAYPDYALEGYELDVIDYLVKPISFERFLMATDKAYERHTQKKMAAGKEQETIILKADHKTYKVNYDDILYIEGAREYVIFHTSHGKIMTLEALRNLEETLPDQFIRIHKSYIVNKEKVTSQHGSRSVEIDEKFLPIGKLYRKRVDIFS